jgi:hypothetical protein
MSAIARSMVVAASDFFHQENGNLLKAAYDILNVLTVSKKTS